LWAETETEKPEMSERKPLTGSVEVFTFKEGLLSRVAHDLCVRVGEFEVLADEATVEARFALRSLRVQHAEREGTPDAAALSAKDRAQIEENIRDKVLHSDRNPDARFSGTISAEAGSLRVSGRLSLHGQAHPLEFPAERSEGRVRGEVELVPSKWGIAPFKAMLGAIKLRDRVLVRFDLTAP
jgi:polyisoprenoid-binding protein YceI